MRSRLTEARKRLQARLSRRGVDLTAVLGAAALGALWCGDGRICRRALLAKAVAAATSATLLRVSPRSSKR